VGGLLDLVTPSLSSAWLAQSTTLWTHSASIALLPVAAYAQAFAAKIAALAAMATVTVWSSRARAAESARECGVACGEEEKWEAAASEE
jgi:hypothetical protein